MYSKSWNKVVPFQKQTTTLEDKFENYAMRISESER